MSAQRKQKIEETECRICVPGEAKYCGLSTDAALKDVTEVASGRKAVKRSKGVSSTPSGSSSSSSYNEEDVGVKPTFPPPIDLTVNQDKRVVSAVPYDELRKEKYFIDKTDLICDMYMAKARAKYYCFPRAGTKSTVVSSLVHWLQYDDATRAERLKYFEGTKIMALVEKEADGIVKDGAIGFNNHIIVAADFANLPVYENTYEEITVSVTKEFCDQLASRYPLSDVVLAELQKLKADDISFFRSLVNRLKDVLPQDSIRRPVLLIIDNFDAPALRILNKEKSSTLSLQLMGFFNFMLHDVGKVDTRFFKKILLFGTHQPIGMNTKSFLKKIPVETYPYGTKEIVKNFFFSMEEVKTVLKNCGEEETKVNELSAICGGYNIHGKDFFHPGCIINYITRQEDEDNAEDPVYWCSVDSLDILCDTSVTLPYEMPLWLFQEEQTLDFQRQKVLIYENFISDTNTAYTYLLEGGYLTRVMNSNPPKYKIVNAEARNLFAARYKQWLNRIPSIRLNIPLTCFETHDYEGFFDAANEILKNNYAGEDFQYEGQYHVFLSSFFHNIVGWHFKSNNQAGYGKFDFVVWNKNPLVETGYVFEIAIVKTNMDPMKKIAEKINEKKNQVEKKEYYLTIDKKVKKCIIVIGCRKMLSYSICNVI